MQTSETLDRAIAYANEHGGMPVSLSGVVNGYEPGHRLSVCAWWHAVMFARNGHDVITWWPDGEVRKPSRRMYLINHEPWYVSGHTDAEDEIFLRRLIDLGVSVLHPTTTVQFMNMSDYRKIPAIRYDALADVMWSRAKQS